MTAIISWSTFDGHGTASLYLASESRLTLPRGAGMTPLILRNDFQKTFAAPDTPDIFAVCGLTAHLPRLIATLYTNSREERSTRTNSNADHYDYTKSLVERVAKQVPLSSHAGLILFHGYRFGALEFGLNRVVLGPIPSYTRVILDPTQGSLYRDGSGASMVEREQTDDPETDARAFSRWLWQSFVSSLQTPTDPYCGGPPQLVGLYREGNGISYGIHFKESVFLSGSVLVQPPSVPDFEFRDELFQRVTFSGELVNGAQIHARNSSTRNLLSLAD